MSYVSSRGKETNSRAKKRKMEELVELTEDLSVDSHTDDTEDKAMEDDAMGKESVYIIRNEKNTYLCEYLLVVEHYYEINGATSLVYDVLRYLTEWVWNVRDEIVNVEFGGLAPFPVFEVYLKDEEEVVTWVNNIEIFGNIRDWVPEDFSGNYYAPLHRDVLGHLLFALEIGERSFISDFDVTDIHGMTPHKQLQLWSEGFRTVEDISKLPDLSERTRNYLAYEEDIQHSVPRKEINFLHKELKKYFRDDEFALVGKYRLGFKKCRDVNIIATPEKALEIVSGLGEMHYLAHGNLPWETEIYDGIAQYEKVDGQWVREVKKNPLNEETVYRDVIKITASGRAHEFIIRAVKKESWATALLLYTGNNAFNTLVRGKASDAHYEITPNYVCRTVSGKIKHPESEEEIFSLFEMPYVDPRERDWIMIPKKDSEANKWGKVSKEFLYHDVPAPPPTSEKTPVKEKKGKKRKKNPKKERS